MRNKTTEVTGHYFFPSSTLFRRKTRIQNSQRFLLSRSLAVLIFLSLSSIHSFHVLFFLKKRGHPHWISSTLEHETGFEPATLALARRYSTTEPLVHTYLQNHILKSSSYLNQLTRPSWISPRPISNSQLHALLHFHLCPIYLVVFKGSYFLTNGISHLEGGFTLRCLQRLSLPDLATRP